MGRRPRRAFTLSVITLLPPTLDPIADPAAILENAGLQTVNLTGITAGGSETQPLQVTAISSNVALIPNPTVTYTSPSATGSLTYTPAANAFGTAIVTVTVSDGGLDNNLATPGDNGTFSRQFTVIVTGVNDPPTLNAIPDPAPIAEDAGLQTVNLTGITAGGSETQPLQVTASSNNTGLIPNPTVTYTSPAATGSLSYTPLANVSGSAIVTVTVTDGGLDNNLGTPGDNGTVSRTFTVVVSGDNDPPTLDAIPDPAAILEDAGAQTVNLGGITAGGGETQVLTVTAISNNVALIPNPTVTYTSPNAIGSLAYTPVANAFGTAIVTVRVTDDGTAFVERSFTVTVTAVNDAPSFTAGANQTVLEDAGPQTVAPWATAISPGPLESDTLTFVVTDNTNPGLFSTGPDVAANGTLTYTPAAGASGTASLTLRLTDNGGTANGGVSQSATQVFVITVTAVNDTPALDAIPDPSAILEDAGLQTVNLSGISAGPGESAQPLQVTASSSNTGLIPNPTVTYTSPNATGSLSYTPAANASGSAVITVTVTDGGTDNNLATPGDNGSVVRTFTVTVTAVNDAPAITAGGTLNFTEGNPPTAISPALTVADVDDTNLESATVTITANYVNVQDILAMPVTAGIASSFNPLTGTLTLTGSATVAAYQAALRTVTYFNNSVTPSIAPRTVAWVVNDGTVSSNIAASTITVTAVNSAPIGVADAWTTFGNTDLVVDQAGPATPFVADTTTSTAGVLDNDTDPEGDPRAVAGIVGCADTTAPYVCTTTAGGSVTMESNGKFTYRPQAGDTGADSFQYVLADVPLAGLPGSVNVTVNLTLQERIWFVDGDVAGPGTGTSSDPFKALPATAGDADDYIFVHDSTVTGGITLQNGQKLYGEGFGLSINQALNGNPAPVVLVAPGGSPDIAASTGNAVGVLANTASGSLANIEIRGLTLATTAASSNAIDVTSANAANVAVTISDVVVNGATAEGIDINQASTGTRDGVDVERHRDLHRHRHRPQRDGRHLDGDRLQRHHHHRRHGRGGHHGLRCDVRWHGGWCLPAGRGRHDRGGLAGGSRRRRGHRHDQCLRRPGVHRSRYLHVQWPGIAGHRHWHAERRRGHRHGRRRRGRCGDAAVGRRPCAEHQQRHRHSPAQLGDGHEQPVDGHQSERRLGDDLGDVRIDCQHDRDRGQRPRRDRLAELRRQHHADEQRRDGLGQRRTHHRHDHLQRDVERDQRSRPGLRRRRQHVVLQLHRHDDAERRRCRHRHPQHVGRHVQLRYGHHDYQPVRHGVPAVGQQCQCHLQRQHH